MLIVRILPALLMMLALECSAAPFAIQVGDSRIGLDAIPGFTDTIPTGSPRLLELAEELTPASNRILLFAISDNDLRRFSQGDTPDLRRYMIAVTPKGLEREHVTPASFQTFVSDSLAELGKPPETQDYVKYLDGRQQGAMSLLAELRRDPEIVSVLQGTRIPPPKVGMFQEVPPPRYILSTTTLLLLRGKALNLTVFTKYEGPADLEWIRVNTVRWTDELRRLNNAR